MGFKPDSVATGVSARKQPGNCLEQAGGRANVPGLTAPIGLRPAFATGLSPFILRNSLPPGIMPTTPHTRPPSPTSFAVKGSLPVIVSDRPLAAPNKGTL